MLTGEQLPVNHSAALSHRLSFPTVGHHGTPAQGLPTTSIQAHRDVFDGFEVVPRREPVSGSGVAIAAASDISNLGHLGPWIKGYGIEFDVTAVVTDAEFASMWPGVKAIADLE